jgi:hypothetical protein
MKINEGKLDRTLRVTVGLILIGLAITDTVGNARQNSAYCRRRRSTRDIYRQGIRCVAV